MLTILGNENRRRILQLLSFRPFYFNEIARRLDVGPKAVIDHLEMLEHAGLVECYQDQSRRKYYRIAEKVVLEVTVSPYSYGVRSYMPEIAEEMNSDISSDLSQLSLRLFELKEKRNQLRKLLNEIESEEMEIRRKATDHIVRGAEDPVEAEILMALISGEASSQALASRLGMPAVVVEDYLMRLFAQGKVQRGPDAWTI